jgi:hypothetical protein
LQSLLRKQKNGGLQYRNQHTQKGRRDQSEFDSRRAPLRAGEASDLSRTAPKIFRQMSNHTRSHSTAGAPATGPDDVFCALSPPSAEKGICGSALLTNR